MHLRTIIAVAAVAAAVAAPAGAATILGLYSTGVDATSNATTGNGADLHWTLDGGPAYTGGTNGSFPIPPWLVDTATSRWITPTPNAADGMPVASYTYSTTFTLAANQVASASIGGAFASDDVATGFLNGHQFTATNDGGFTFRTAFADGSDFVAGVNTLTFVVVNSGAGPTGLNVVVSGTADAAVVPEPAAWALMIAGFGLVGAASRRRRTIVAA